MFYYGVLGYTNNILIQNYQEKYFLKLSQIAVKIFQQENILNQKKRDEFKIFLLHPDISSLLMDFEYTGSQSSQDQFLYEVQLFFDGKDDESVSFSGKKIKGTDIYMSLEDNNPSNGVVGHPDHDASGMIGWGEKTPEEWNEVFSQSLALLKKVNEDFYNELNYIIKKIVPMKTSIDVHNSCSYKECVGTLYLGYTINHTFPELDILEALIHESSHNKLNLIMQSEKLTLNDYELKYYSPYRPDARHIHGVFLGVHAIVPTVYVLLQAIESGYIQDRGWQEKVILYHIKNKLGYRVLQKYAKTTPIGRKILDDIATVMSLCDEMIRNSQLLSIIDKIPITQKAKEHFSTVQHNYPYLQY